MGKRDGGVCHGGQGQLGQGVCESTLSVQEILEKSLGTLLEDVKVFPWVHYPQGSPVGPSSVVGSAKDPPIDQEFPGSSCFKVGENRCITRD